MNTQVIPNQHIYSGFLDIINDPIQKYIEQYKQELITAENKSIFARNIAELNIYHRKGGKAAYEPILELKKEAINELMQQHKHQA